MAIIEYQLDALVTVSGGFHNAGPLRLRIKAGDESLSAGQYKRLKRHLCGIAECQCETLKHDVSGIAQQSKLIPAYSRLAIVGYWMQSASFSK